MENIFDEYSHWTDNVAVYPKVHEPHYLALGLVEEMGELLRAESNEDIIAETGDVLWYGARYARLVLDVPFSSICERDIALENAVMNGYEAIQPLSIIAGTEKKRLRDGETWDAKKIAAKHSAASLALSQLMQYALHTAAECCGTPPSAVIAANISKLSARRDVGTIRGDGDHR